MSGKLKVVLFSGGRGAGTICEALVQHPQLSLTLVVNAYDDGLSTGALRRFIPGMLGPSDVRKNLSRLIPGADRADRAMRSLLEYRFPVGTTAADAVACLEAFTRAEPPARFPQLAAWLNDLGSGQARDVARYCARFLAYAAGREFDYSDCSLGNLFFAGCYLEHGSDFNAAIRALSATCRARGQVLNISRGENLVLVGLKEDGTFLKDEAEIVSKQSVASLSEIFLLPAYLAPAEADALRALPFEERRAELRRRARAPQLSEDSRRALAEADIIIYGPGTQHSSLFPSYMTDGVAEAIAGNAEADKFFVANILKDHEIRKETAGSLVEKFLFYMGRKGQVPVQWSQFITRFFFQGAVERGDSEEYVRFDPARFPYPRDRVVLTDWEIQNGVHSGGRFRDELIRFVNVRLDQKLQTLAHAVSIVVPALNEERTVQAVLHDLSRLDFQSLGLSKEIIFVDGGSTDRTLELARAVPGVKVHTLDGEKGRGATIRHGIAQATGNIIVTFPSDAEYSAADLIPVVMAISRNEYPVVFGSRAIKCLNLNEQIARIYQRDRLGYLIGKYGGMVISILSLLIYNRFISDPLTGIKAFDSRVIQGLLLRSRGMDLETEIFAKLSLSEQFIYELPVSYFPRRKVDGKKSTVWDGLAALLALFRFRFARPKRHEKAVSRYSRVQ
jgi:2-phospho-L-lactate transferase/gluconeogenesis factor (CofD/UPF0052 family)/glycosyltransferase involved in cell wall biosynthesis